MRVFFWREAVVVVRSAAANVNDIAPAAPAASLEDYIAFSRGAGWHFMVYSVRQKRWLGELRLGDRPQLVASDG